MKLHNRIRGLFDHLGIERAHFVGGGTVGDLIDLCVAAPDLAASLTLVGPMSISKATIGDLSAPLTIVAGDQGNVFERINSAL